MKRLAAVVVVALAGFVAAFVAFGDAARANCVLDAPSDATYSATFEEPVQATEEAVLRITRDGQPVTGAWACANVAPAASPDASVAAEAREVEPGRYAVSLDLSTAGTWSGTVLVEEDGAHSEVSVPVSFEVVGGD